MEAREGFSKSEKAMMCHSRETLEGLHITGMVHVHVNVCCLKADNDFFFH